MSIVVPDINLAISRILQCREETDPTTAVLVGVSGIDGSGKGVVSQCIVERLSLEQVRAILIPGDGWLNLPETRFSKNEPARHFYDNALRLPNMFEEMILPLRQQRSHRGVMNYAGETATAYRVLPYEFENVDVIVLECIFLFKRSYRHYFDIAIWIDCSFETALDRATRRGQEDLPEAETVRAYETVYFPAQRIHFEEDKPRGAADVIVDNDGSDVSP